MSIFYVFVPINFSVFRTTTAKAEKSEKNGATRLYAQQLAFSNNYLPYTTPLIFDFSPFL